MFFDGFEASTSRRNFSQFSANFDVFQYIPYHGKEFFLASIEKETTII